MPTKFKELDVVELTKPIISSLYGKDIVCEVGERFLLVEYNDLDTDQHFWDAISLKAPYLEFLVNESYAKKVGEIKFLD